MSEFAVDASVALKWFLPEIHSDAALRVLEHHGPLVAPDLLLAEVTNALWKHVRRQDMTIQEARTTLAALGQLPLTLIPSRALTELALEIAHRTDRSAYDSLYIAVAVLRGHGLVTADRRLYDALRRGPFSASLVWVTDVE